MLVPRLSEDLEKELYLKLKLSSLDISDIAENMKHNVLEYGQSSEAKDIATLDLDPKDVPSTL